MVNAEIKILPLFGKTLDSRDEAIKLFERLKEYCPSCGEIALDFSEVDFMSRSFADQFHKEKMDWTRKSNMILIIQNAPEQVNQILASVRKTQNHKIYKITNTKIHTFSNHEPLFLYLNNI